MSSDRSKLTIQTTSYAHSNAGIVIIGAGMAGSRFAIELARAQQQRKSPNNQRPLPITLISKETEVGYNRIMLSPVLAGDSAFEDTYLYQQSDYEQLGIVVLAGIAVTAVDTKQQSIKLDNGQTLVYAKLVIATGSSARVIPFPNHDATGVHVFREVADVNALIEYARQGKKGLVIGGGVLGLEAACALASQGADMTVIHVDSYVLNRQLDLPAAQLLQAELARRGVGVEVSAITDCIAVNDQHEVQGLSLKDGRTLPADFIVMAVGVMPNIALARDSGLEVNRGIIVDDCMHTSCPHVYAVGECIELDGELFGMVAPVNQQVDTLVSVLKDTRLSGDSLGSKKNWQPFRSTPLSLKLKVSGISAFSAGQVDFDDEEAAAIETITYQQTSINHYHCLYLRDNKLIGAVLYGEVNEGSFYSQLINSHSDIAPIKADLIFGEAYCDLEKVTTDSEVIGDIDNDSDLDLLSAADIVGAAS
ncbi:NAD(P)/FAD-dependent oxidoreductase [Psychrobacter sp. ANT_H56B]|uniref:NAD(P)/FAD-dependent oxidoreductase n=1 Tax=Psychrobacter sp. ANT_H56B TaxID=2597353 RepID=UPI0011F1C596|nr:FAD-dependent oxidoreductase [Psychrobacter sp. ANT_H56B]KAA0929231.1 NAD(P)/FAD-dependent oxidoreductase [Psychrobacter sp. ANT_H56B]